MFHPFLTERTTQEVENSVSGSSKIDEESSENDLESFCEVEADMSLVHDKKKISSEID
jgi:hypothetical protein